MKEIKYEELDKKQKELLNQAQYVMDNSYSPYSGFSVGAAILSVQGKIITGTNVENIDYGSSICAERAAVLSANAMGIKDFEKIAIIAKGKDFDTEKITPPCGSCRQVLYEFAQISNKDIEIIMSTTKKDKIILATINELLPLGVGPEDLGITKD